MTVQQGGRRVGRPVLVSVLLVVSAACAGGGSPLGDSAPPGQGKSPELVNVASGTVTTGFAVGRLRALQSVEAFSINKHPITHAQYGACVKEGACQPVSKAACSRRARESLGLFSADLDDSPVACVEPAQAERYCAWIGGKLPTLSQWLLAARGSNPQRYPWGADAANCERHPRTAAETEAGTSQRLGCLGEGARDLAVGDHPAGSSELGMEDVLLLPAELLATEPDTKFVACRTPGKACMVYGLSPGAIDSVAEVIGGTSEGSPVPFEPATSFRCVREGT